MEIISTGRSTCAKAHRVERVVSFSDLPMRALQERRFVHSRSNRRRLMNDFWVPTPVVEIAA